MVDIDVEIEGFDELLDELEDLEDRWTGDTTYYVGTAVEYSVTPMPRENRTNSGKRYVAS